MARMLARRRVALVVLAAALAAAPACTRGTGAADSAGSPSASPSAPTASPSPTAAAPVQMGLGEPASLTLEGRGGERSTVDLTVTKVVEGRIKHLDDFELGRKTRRSTPYYATVKVTNTGSGDLAGMSVTLWGLDSEGTVRPPANILGTFPRCQPERLPKKFKDGDSARTCLLYLLPEGTTLEAVQYRFSGDRPPVSWPVG